MKLEISNRLSIWPRRLVSWDWERKGIILVHYECSEIMSQDGGCHLGVESGHLIVIMDTMVTVGCWPGHKCPAFYCRVIWYPAEVLMLAAQLTADMIRGKVLKCYPCRRACDDECIMYLLLQQLQWSLYMQRGLLQQQGSNLEQLPTHCSILQGCAVTTQNVSHIQNVCLHQNVSIFEEDISIQTENCSWVSQSPLTRPHEGSSDTW